MTKIEGGTRTRGEFKRRPDTDRPLVSVVTVCLNSGKYLEEAILSVMNQGYDNIEHIIIDGGSRDGTLDIVKKYQDHIAYWMSEPDNGVYDAMNKGISLATGDIVGILNSDDWYHPRALERLIAAYAKNPGVDVFYGDMLYVRMDGGFLKAGDCDIEGKYMTRKSAHENMLEKWSIYHPTCFVSRKNYSERKFNPSLKFSGDYDFLLYLYNAGKKFFYIEEPMVYYRPVGLTSELNYRCVLEKFRIRRRYKLAKAAKCLIAETRDYLRESLYAYKVKFKKRFPSYWNALRDIRHYHLPKIRYYYIKGTWNLWRKKKASARDLWGRCREVCADPNNKFIPRVKNAGKEIDDCLIMHNGLKVKMAEFAYCDDFARIVLTTNKGVHEPQEERVFMEVLKHMPEKAAMIELGAYWAFYSMWFKKEVNNASCYMIEPDEQKLICGKENFKLNGMDGFFVKGKIGYDDGIRVDDFIKEKKLGFVHILHSDIQGAELEMLRSCEQSILKNMNQISAEIWL